MKLDLSLLQYLCFPAMLLAAARVSFGGRRIPRSLLLGALLCGAAGGTFAYSFHNDPHKGFLISRLSDDTYEADTRIFRERINKIIGKSSGVRGTRFYRSLASASEAQSFLRDHPGVNAVVWGGDRWINISFAAKEPLDLMSAKLPQLFARRFNVKVVTGVPVIGLGLQPSDATPRFIAALMRGALEDDGEDAASLSELDLLQAGVMQAAWSSDAHKAYAWWLLGNAHLIAMLRRGVYEPGEIECALKYYTAGLRFAGEDDNPPLRGALLNNQAVAWYVQAAMEGRDDLLPQARKGFERAQRVTRESNVFGVRADSAFVARENILRIAANSVSNPARDAKRAARAEHMQKLKEKRERILNQ